MAVVMILQVFVITPTYAADIRIKISNIVATSDTDSIPVYGGKYKRPTFTVTAGEQAYFRDDIGGYWLKKEGEEWNPYVGKTFTEGSYKYKVQIRIDGEAGTTHVLDSNGVTATVDGNKWADNRIPTVTDMYSYVWAESKEYVITKTSTETAIEIPKANTDLTYTGNPQTGVNEGAGYTLTGNTATNAGTYTAKATLKAGYKWSDGSTEVKNISFEIKKARPTFTEPTGLKGQKGAKLSTVTLPTQFKWKNGDLILNTVGDNTYYATFTPNDTTNYEVIDVDLTVKVEGVEHNITVVNGNSNQASAKQGTSVTVTATVPADKEFDTWEATGITLTDAQKKENPLTITMPDNDVTLTAKFADKVKLTNIKIKTMNVGGMEWQYLNPPLPYNENIKEYTIELESKIQYFQIELTCDTSKIQAKLINARNGYPMTLYTEDTCYISHAIQGIEQAYKIELSKDGSVIDTYVLKVKRVNGLIEIDKPKVTNSFVYDGTEKIAIQDGIGYGLSNHKATNAGEYEAIVTLEDGYKWKESGVSSLTYPWKIEKADPTYTVPTELKGKKGAKLSTVTLPSGFTWIDGEKVLDTVGEMTFKAKFTPTDTNNYKVVELDVKVMVEDNIAPPTPTVTGIAVNSTTHKKEYKVGEELDVTNLTIEVTKSDGTKETVNVEKSMVTGFDSSTANPNQELTITYEGKTATYTIKIEEVTTPPTTYTVSFDANGGEGTMPSKTVNAGAIYKLPACTFTPPVGKEFKAWEVNGVEKTVGTDITINADTVLKAVWKDKSVTPPTPPTPPTPSVPDVMPLPFGPGYNPLWMIYFRPVGQVESKHITRVKTNVTLTIDSKIMEKSVNGIEEKITVDVAPFITDGRTMLPIRFVAEALGFNVQWIKETRTVVLTDKDNVITIPVDTNKIVVNGKVYESDVKPVIRNGRTMLPIANIARALGLNDGTEILWDEVNRKVTIIREQVIDNR